jgi:hypothetical protein
MANAGREPGNAATFAGLMQVPFGATGIALAAGAPWQERNLSAARRRLTIPEVAGLISAPFEGASVRQAGRLPEIGIVRQLLQHEVRDIRPGNADLDRSVCRREAVPVYARARSIC